MNLPISLHNDHLQNHLETSTHHVIYLRHVRDDVTDSNEWNIIGNGLAQFRVRLVLRSKFKEFINFKSVLKWNQNLLCATVEMNVERLHDALTYIKISARIELVAHLAQRNYHVAIWRVWNHVNTVNHLIFNETLFNLVCRRAVAIHASSN